MKTWKIQLLVNVYEYCNLWNFYRKYSNYLENWVIIIVSTKFAMSYITNILYIVKIFVNVT